MHDPGAEKQDNLNTKDKDNNGEKYFSQPGNDQSAAINAIGDDDDKQPCDQEQRCIV
ncbi:hypothetical protein D3C73_1590820 [compost metagenome]